MKPPNCAACASLGCRNGRDCRHAAESHLELYADPELVRLHRAASAVEADHYCRANRLQEVVLFAREMNFTRIGLAFCIGLAQEAAVVADYLGGQGIEVVSVCCKNCGIPKQALSLTQIDRSRQHETMCNPLGQAALLNEADTQFNVIVGLCIGHDALFTMRSAAPVSTLIAKDRVLGHNPVAAVYCQYIRRNNT